MGGSGHGTDETRALPRNLDATTRVEATPAREGGRLARGMALGRYLVLEEVGRGGMGVVYAAYDPDLDRRIALKLLRGASDGDGRARLLREAQAMARLSHPHVVVVHDVGTVGDSVFLAMEFLDGGTLRDFARTEEPSWSELLRRYLAAGEGLRAAHAAGIVHRDFKADNVLCDRAGRVRVADFGLARALDAPPAPQGDDAPSSGTLGSPLTQRGAILGTPAYMAPEQIAGLPADARSDQYSFCVALWEALYGRRPYDADTLDGLASAMKTERPVAAPSALGAPAALRKILERGLRIRPADRYPSMDALLASLRHLLGARARRLAALTAVLALALAGLVVAAPWRTSRDAACGDLPDGLVGVFDEPHREALREAFTKAAPAFAGPALAAVFAYFERYRAQWKGQRRYACEVALSGGTAEAEGQRACLERRRVELAALVDVFASADRAVVLGAARAVERLASPGSCGLARAGGGAPFERRAILDAASELLAKSRAQRIAGRHAEAMAMLEALGPEVEKLGDRRLKARLWLQRARVHEMRGEGPAAAKAFTTALALALGASSRIGNVAVTAATQLGFGAGLSLGHPDEGERFLEIANELLRRAPDADELRPRVLMAEAALADVRGRYADGLRKNEEAIAATRRTAPGRELVIARFQANRAIFLARLDRNAEAKAVAEEALRTQERRLGPRHPVVAETLATLGQVLVTLGDRKAALSALERARAIMIEAFGPEPSALAAVALTSGNALFEEGRLAEALARFEEALRIAERQRGPEHPAVASVLNNLATTLAALGRDEAARAATLRALAIREKVLGPRHPEVAFSLHNLAELDRKAHRCGEALPRYATVLAIWEKSYGAESGELVEPLTSQGECLLERGETRGGIAALERAVRLADKPDVGVPERARAKWLLARALARSAPASPRALALAADARTLFAGAGRGHEKRAKEIDAWLAKRGAAAARGMP